MEYRPHMGHFRFATTTQNILTITGQLNDKLLREEISETIPHLEFQYNTIACKSLVKFVPVVQLFLLKKVHKQCATQFTPESL